MYCPQLSEKRSSKSPRMKLKSSFPRNVLPSFAFSTNFRRVIMFGTETFLPHFSFKNILRKVPCQVPSASSNEGATEAYSE